MLVTTLLGGLSNNDGSSASFTDALFIIPSLRCLGRKLLGVCESGFVADYLVHNKFEDRRSAKSALICNMNVGSQSRIYLDSIVVVARCRGKGYGDSDGVLLDHVRCQQHPPNVLDQEFLPR